MNDSPSPRNQAEVLFDEQYAAATDNAVSILVQNVESQRNEELKARRLEEQRQLQQLIDRRERELRERNRAADPYDSDESGYGSVSNRRRFRVARAEQRISERMRNRERSIQEQKKKEQLLEEKKELDAVFHILLHDDDDYLLTDPNDYDFRLPDFMNFDEIKRGFDEQMKIERLIREEADKKALDEIRAREIGESLERARIRRAETSASAATTDWKVFQRIKSEDFKQENIKTELIKQEKMRTSDIKTESFQPVLEDVDLSNYMSMDEDEEEEEQKNRRTKSAMKPFTFNTEPSTSSGITSGSTSGWIPPPNTVFIVHDSDSE